MFEYRVIWPGWAITGAGGGKTGRTEGWAMYVGVAIVCLGSYSRMTDAELWRPPARQTEPIAESCGSDARHVV